MEKRVYPKRSDILKQIQYSFESGVFYLTLCEFHGKTLCAYKVPVPSDLSYKVFCFDRCGVVDCKCEYDFFLKYARKYGVKTCVKSYSVGK